MSPSVTSLGESPLSSYPVVDSQHTGNGSLLFKRASLDAVGVGNNEQAPVRPTIHTESLSNPINADISDEYNDLSFAINVSFDPSFSSPGTSTPFLSPISPSLSNPLSSSPSPVSPFGSPYWHNDDRFSSAFIPLDPTSTLAPTKPRLSLLPPDDDCNRPTTCSPAEVFSTIVSAFPDDVDNDVDLGGIAFGFTEFTDDLDPEREFKTSLGIDTEMIDAANTDQHADVDVDDNLQFTGPGGKSAGIPVPHSHSRSPSFADDGSMSVHNIGMDGGINPTVLVRDGDQTPFPPSPADRREQSPPAADTSARASAKERRRTVLARKPEEKSVISDVPVPVPAPRSQAKPRNTRSRKTATTTTTDSGVTVTSSERGLRPIASRRQAGKIQRGLPSVPSLDKSSNTNSDMPSPLSSPGSPTLSSSLSSTRRSRAAKRKIGSMLEDEEDQDQEDEEDEYKDENDEDDDYQDDDDIDVNYSQQPPSKKRALSSRSISATLSLPSPSSSIGPQLKFEIPRLRNGLFRCPHPECKDSEKTFTRKHDTERHMKTRHFHSKEGEGEATSTSTGLGANLRRDGEQRVGGEADRQSESGEFRCRVCRKPLSRLDARRRHERQQHGYGLPGTEEGEPQKRGRKKKRTC